CNCFKQVVDGRSRVLGPDHRRTIDNRHDLGQALIRAKKYEEALSVHQENLEWSKKTFGPKHSSTLETIECIAQLINLQGALLANAGKVSEAEPRFREGLAVLEPVADRFKTGTAGQQFTLAMVSHSLARCLAYSPDNKPARVKEAVLLAKQAVDLVPGEA